MFTQKQIEEILDAIELRHDVITDDPASATEWETPERLSVLGGKLMTIYERDGFTDGEINWLHEELGNKIEMALGSIHDPELKHKASGEINSLNNAMGKIK